jgi:uncharacterized protein (UPF0333 family)
MPAHKIFIHIDYKWPLIIVMAKAQTGLEYIFIFGFSLLIISVLWIISAADVSSTRWDLQVASAASALSKISDAADAAYIQGPPAQFYIYPAFPDNVNAVYISSNAVTMELVWKEGILRNITSETIANLTGSLTRAHGTHKILVRAGGGFVNITEV